MRIWARESQYKGVLGTPCEDMGQQVSITMIINNGNQCEDRWTKSENEYKDKNSELV